MRKLTALLVVAALALPSVGYAQSPDPPAIDVTKMGISLDRIRRSLGPNSGENSTFRNGRLDVRVDVFGIAPPIDLIPKDFSLTYGPVPHSAPSHREHIEFVTPQEYSAPVVPIFGLAVWAAQKLAEHSKKSQCEQEVEAYRALIMQGVAVAAPRCTQ